MLSGANWFKAARFVQLHCWAACDGHIKAHPDSAAAFSPSNSRLKQRPADAKTTRLRRDPHLKDFNEFVVGVRCLAPDQAMNHLIVDTEESLSAADIGYSSNALFPSRIVSCGLMRVSTPEGIRGFLQGP
ncbi:DUF1917 domain-containing protein [Pseudomonas sp. S60]|nr:DUF1917 domain-containing protein [Pseudomonas sp. S60]